VRWEPGVSHCCSHVATPQAPLGHQIWLKGPRIRVHLARIRWPNLRGQTTPSHYNLATATHHHASAVTKTRHGSRHHSLVAGADGHVVHAAGCPTRAITTSSALSQVKRARSGS
jgi:hypothetical protein